MTMSDIDEKRDSDDLDSYEAGRRDMALEVLDSLGYDPSEYRDVPAKSLVQITTDLADTHGESDDFGGYSPTSNNNPMFQ